MERIYQFVEETVARFAEAQFDLFKKFHEKRLKDAPSITRKINEEALLEVSKKSVLQMKGMFSKEEMMEDLSHMEQADLDTLAKGQGMYSIIVQRYDLWIKYIVCSKKQEYLNALLLKPGIPSVKEEKEYTHWAGGIAMNIAYREGKIDEDDFIDKNRPMKFISRVFNVEFERSGIRSVETTYKAKNKIYNKGLEWAKKNHSGDYELGMKLYKKHFLK